MSLLKLFQKAAQSHSTSAATVSIVEEDEIDASNSGEPDPTPPGKLGESTIHKYYA